MADAEQVAIAIVGYRNPGDVTLCLEALSRSAFRDFKVYICENGGPEAFRTLAETVPPTLPSGQSVVLINPGDNLGYAGGVNRCLDEAGDGFRAVWVLNPDTEPEPPALGALLARLDRGDVDAVGGVLIWSNGTVQGYGGRWNSWFGLGGSIGMFAPADAPVDAARVEAEQAYLLGASMLVGRRFLERVGRMRDDYFLYGEEVEWFLRARRQGVRLGFAPDARVRHHHGTTTGWSGPFRQWPKLAIYLDARNRVRMTAQLTPIRVPTAVAGILLHSLWRFARRGAFRQTGYVIEGVLAGLRDESGRPAWAG